MAPIISPIMAAQMAAKNAPAPLPTAIALPSAAPNLGMPALPNVTRLPSATDLAQQRVTALQASPSGVDQIKNPFLHGLAKFADIVGGIATPGLAMAIPGTQLHHQVLVQQAQQQLAESQKSDQEQAQTAQTQAGTAHENAETSALTAPNYTPLQTDSGTVAFDHKTGKAEPVLGADGTQVGAPDKTPKPLSIEERAYDYAIQSGKNPLDAYSAVYGAKNTKDAGLPQQYLDAISSGDATKAGLIKQVIHDTQVQPKIDVHTANAPADGASRIHGRSGLATRAGHHRRPLPSPEFTV